MKLCSQCGSELKEGVRFCPQCGTAVEQQMEAAQPARTKKPTKIRWIVLGVLLIAFIALFVTYLRVLLREYHPVIADQPTVVVPIQYGLETKVPSSPTTARMKDGKIVLLLETVKQQKLVRFFDPEGIQSTPMISYITPEGKVVTAMSLSENCRSTDFFLQGHNIHCASCPSYWNMSSLEAYACCQRFYPDPIPSALVDGEIQIDAAVVRKWHPRS